MSYRFLLSLQAYLGLDKDILPALIFNFMRRQLYVCVTGK